MVRVLLTYSQRGNKESLTVRKIWVGGGAAAIFQHSACAMAVALGFKANSQPLIPFFSFTFKWKKMLSEICLSLTVIVHYQDELCMSFSVWLLWKTVFTHGRQVGFSNPDLCSRHVNFRKCEQRWGLLSDGMYSFGVFRTCRGIVWCCNAVVVNPEDHDAKEGVTQSEIIY